MSAGSSVRVLDRVHRREPAGIPLRVLDPDEDPPGHGIAPAHGGPAVFVDLVAGRLLAVRRSELPEVLARLAVWDPWPIAES